MKNILLTILALAFLIVPALAIANEAQQLTKVETKFVCMINNQLFEKEQIPVVVNGKTYYGCCHMCEVTLKNDKSSREAIDPISGKTVDKATAVIGAEPSNDVHYFENEENMRKFKIKK